MRQPHKHHRSCGQIDPQSEAEACDSLFIVGIHQHRMDPRIIALYMLTLNRLHKRVLQ